MHGFYFRFLNRQDLQDFEDFFYFRFQMKPEIVNPLLGKCAMPLLYSYFKKLYQISYYPRIRRCDISLFAGWRLKFSRFHQETVK